MEAKRIDEAEIAAILGYPAENREALGLALGFDGMTAQHLSRGDLENVTEEQLLLARDIVREAYSTAHYAGAQNDFTCGVGATIVRLYRDRANRPPPRPRRPLPSKPALSADEAFARIAANTEEYRARREAVLEGIRQGRGLSGPAPKPEAVTQ